MSAGASIIGIETSVREIAGISAGESVTGIAAVGGYGDPDSGVILGSVEAGQDVEVSAEGNLFVAEARAATGNLELLSGTGTLFVGQAPDGDGDPFALSAGADLVLGAGFDITLTGNLRSTGLLTMTAGNAIGTRGGLVELEAGSIEINAAGSVSLGGDLGGLETLTIRSGETVNLPGNIPGRVGLTVVTPSLSQQAQDLDDLREILLGQIEVQQAIEQDERLLLELEEGGSDLLTHNNGAALDQLLRLPLQLQRAQVRLQRAPVVGMFEAQALDPDRIAALEGLAGIALELSEAEGALAADRASLAENQLSISEVRGDLEAIAGFEAQLESSRALRNELGSLLTRVDSLGRNIGPTQPGAAVGVDLLPSALTSQVLAGMSTEALGALVEAATAEIGILNDQIGVLGADISENEGSLALLGRGLEEAQGDLANLESSLVPLQSEVTRLTGELNGILSAMADQRGLTELESSITSLESEIASRESEIALLSSEISELTGKISDAEGDLLREEEILGGLNAGLSPLEGEVTRLTGVVDDLGEVDLSAHPGILALDEELNDLGNRIEGVNQVLIDYLNLQLAGVDDRNIEIDDALSAFEGALGNCPAGGGVITPGVGVVNPGGGGLILGGNDPLRANDLVVNDLVVGDFDGQINLDGNGVIEGVSNLTCQDLGLLVQVRSALISEAATVELERATNLEALGAQVQADLTQAEANLSAAEDAVASKQLEIAEQQSRVVGLEGTRDALLFDVGRLTNEREALAGELESYESGLADALAERNVVVGLVEDRDMTQSQLNTAVAARDAKGGEIAAQQQVVGNLVAERNIQQQNLSVWEQAAAGLEASIAADELTLAGLELEAGGLQLQLDEVLLSQEVERNTLVETFISNQGNEGLLVNAAHELILEQHQASQLALTTALRGSLVHGEGSLNDLLEELAQLDLERQAVEESLASDGLQEITIVAGQDSILPNRADSSEIPGGDIVLQDDETGFYVYQVGEDGPILYRDIGATPDQPDDDVWYEWRGALEPDQYAFDGTLSLRVLLGETRMMRTEIRRGDGEEREVEIEILEPVFAVHDFAITLIKGESDTDPSDETESLQVVVNNQLGPLSTGDISAIDPDGDGLTSLNSLVPWLTSRIRGESPDPSGDFIPYDGEDSETLEIVYDGQVQSGDLEDEDMLVYLMDLRPQLTQLSDEVYRTEFGALADIEFNVLPDSFAEYYYEFDGDHTTATLLNPLLEIEEEGHIVIGSNTLPIVQGLLDGLIREGVGPVPRVVGAASLVSLDAEGQLRGLDRFITMTADVIDLSSGAAERVGATLIADSELYLTTGGPAGLQLDGARLSAPVINFDAWDGGISGPEGVLEATTLIIDAAGPVDLTTTVNRLRVSAVPDAAVTINNLGGSGSLDLVQISGVGEFSVTSEGEIIARNVSADGIAIEAGGDLMVGSLSSSQAVLLDAGRSIQDLAGSGSVVTADTANLLAGGGIQMDRTAWNVAQGFTEEPNLSIFLDDSHDLTGGDLNLTATRDIIIDRAIDIDGSVELAGRNILFTENGSIRSTSPNTVNLSATEVIDFGSPLVESTILESPAIILDAETIRGTQRAVFSGDSLEVTTASDLVLETRVAEILANLSGAGDLVIHSRGAVELGEIYIEDGSLQVNAPSEIVTRSLRVNSDRFTNSVTLNGGRGVTVEELIVGPNVELVIPEDIAAPSPLGVEILMDAELGPVLEDQSALVTLRITDPSGVLVTNGQEISLTVDFGDGSEPVSMTVPVERPNLGDPAFVVDGPESDFYLGRSLALADVNGDGFSDLVVGQPLGETSRPELGSGVLYVFLGSEEGLRGAPDSGVFGRLLRVSELGRQVVGAGDVNGDGFDDLIVTSAHEVLLFYGSVEGLSQQSAVELAIPHHDDEEGNESELVIEVATAGDVNQDGFDDLLIGLPLEESRILDANGQGFEIVPSAGRVQLHLGASDAGVIAPAWVVEGADPRGLLGASVSGAGDINGDGFDDVLLGAPGEGGSRQGQVHVFLGSDSGLDTVGGEMLTGTEVNGQFGAAVAGLGDLNGDGFDDVVIGSPGHPLSGGGLRSGVVQVLQGSAEGLFGAGVLEAGPGVTGFGGMLVAAGDTNGDTVPDFLVHGVGHNDLEEVFLFRGSPANASGVNPGAILVTRQANGSPQNSLSLVSLGDLNGDGLNDIVVGEPWFGSNQQGQIRVYVGVSSGSSERVIAESQFLHIYEEEGAFTISATALIEGVDGVGVALQIVNVLSSDL